MNPIEIVDLAGFRAAVRTSVDAAMARGSRSLLFVDADFSAWPLDDPALLDALAGWLRRPGRRLTLLGQRFERMEREHPRFTQWRPAWSHGIEARCPDEVPTDGLETLLLDDGPTVLTLWQRDPPRGRAAGDPAAAAAARDRIDAPLQRSTPAWPVRPLGL
jgi:hypothetical protein